MAFCFTNLGFTLLMIDIARVRRGKEKTRGIWVEEVEEKELELGCGRTQS